MKRRLCLLLAAILALSGCSGLSAEELYRLPQAPEDYYDLQEALGDVLAQGYNYLAPASGTRQEPIQRTDLDGDGVDEAVAFFRSDAGGVEIYIFSKENDVYVPAAVIDGAGSAVAAVEYADLDGQGDLEIILTYQVSGAVPQALQVYRYDENGAVSVLSGSCSRYELADLDGDGLPELLCVTSAGAKTPATVEYYDGQNGRLKGSGQQKLSFDYDSLSHAAQGALSDGAGGVLLSGVSEEGTLVTDVFTASEDGLRQVVPKKDILRSETADGSHYAYPADIDGDGVIEVAVAEALPGAGETPRVIRWYGLAGDGGCADKAVTYQKFDENWYFRFPEHWDGAVTAEETASATVSSVRFYRILPEAEGDREEILTIYTLRGGNRQSYVEENGLSTLYSGSDVLYAAALNGGAKTWEGTITLAQVSEMFHMVNAKTGDSLRENN